MPGRGCAAQPKHQREQKQGSVGVALASPLPNPSGQRRWVYHLRVEAHRDTDGAPAGPSGAVRKSHVDGDLIIRKRLRNHDK